ncbi:MAG: prepilin peptidase [Acidobacteriaceae bacterium]|nr:prepilin peptidase [Acidobacteriaceae bacterium]
MPALLTVALLALVLVAGVYDLRFRRIPNWLSVSGAVLGVALNLAWFGWRGGAAAAWGLLLALVVYVPLYLIRGMGAGDVKLMGAVGAIVGPANWLSIFLATSLLGGIVSVALVMYKKRLQQTVFNLAAIGVAFMHFRAPAESEEQLDVRNPRALRLPHAAVIAAGTIAFLLWSRT